MPIAMNKSLIILLLFAFVGCGNANSNKPDSQATETSDSIPAKAFELKELGNQKASNGDNAGAIEYYTKAIEIFPNYAIAYYNRGLSKYDSGDLKGAIEDYTKAIEINPKDEDSYYCRAIAKGSLGDQKGAIADYTKTIGINPHYTKAYYGRAMEKGDLRDWKGAIKDYTKAIEINPLYCDAYINRGVTKYEMGDYEGEIADYRLCIKMCKDQPYADLYNNLGRALYDLKRFKESAEAYGQGIEFFPKDGKLYYGRGLARNQSGDREGACQDWYKSLRFGVEEARVLLVLCTDCEPKREPNDVEPDGTTSPKSMVDAYWVDEQSGEKHREVRSGEEGTLYICTRGYKPGEKITVEITADEGRVFEDGSTEMSVSGTVNKDGVAIVKKFKITYRK